MTAPLYDIRKIAVVNRGEAALRFVRAVHEYNREHDLAIDTLALVTAGEANAPFARLASDTVMLTPRSGGGAASAYLDIDEVMRVITASGADAVWVGWGFLAENADFAERVVAAGLTFIGPRAESMRMLGDKIAGKRLAEACGVPVVPWSRECVASLAEAERVVAEIGLPAVLKASAGGGGRGIRLVRERCELAAAYQSARAEALRAFGDDRLFIERCIESARHLEVQIVGDDHGHVLALGVRDCSVQRRHQKVIEEAPGPHTTPMLVHTLETHALALARAARYRSVGTVEFLYDRQSGAVYFMEMNTRLQVEHPITELVQGVDLVKLQLDIARRRSLEELVAAPRGYAIEVRLNAEDPDRDFAPAAGRISHFVAAQGPGVRVDSGVVEGSEIPPEFDSMIAKIIAYGRDRGEALARLRRALADTQVIVRGGATNKTLLTTLLAHPAFVAGDIDTRWLDRNLSRLSSRPYAAEALIAAAVFGYRAEGQKAHANFFNAVARGVPQILPDTHGRTIQLTLRGARYTAEVRRLSYTSHRVTLAGHGTVEVTISDDGPGSCRIRVGARRLRVLYEVSEQEFYVELDGIAHRIMRDAGGIVRSPAPSLVMALAVGVGDLVKAGDHLGSLEAMKMEMPLRAPYGGRVSAVFAQPNSQVAAGAPLLAIEALDSADGVDASTPVVAAPLELPSGEDDFSALFDAEGEPRREIFDGPQAPQCAAALTGEVRRIMLGYDLDDARVDKLARALDDEQLWSELGEPRPYRSLSQAIAAYVDSELLFAPDRLPARDGAPPIAFETAFYDYARRLHLGVEGAHPEYVAYLKRALLHFDIESLEPTPKLKHAIVRLALAHRRSDGRAAVKQRMISSVLRLLMGLHRAGADFTDDEPLRQQLGRLAAMTVREWPFVADNAYQTLYVLFHQLHYERRRGDTLQSLEATLAAAAALDPGDGRREELINELVCTSQPVLVLLGRATRDDGLARTRVAAEALFRRRYYLDSQRRVTVHEHGNLLVFEDRHAAVCRRIVGVVTHGRDLLPALRELDSLAPWPEGTTVADVLVHCDGATTGDVLGEADRLLREGMGRGVARLCVSVADDSPLAPQVTFVREGAGFVEVERLRNVHPEMGERLELWRLSEFTLQRVSAHERLLVYHGRARSNPQDERIFVIGEVGDAPEGAATGQASDALLGFEHAFFEAVRTVREIQACRQGRRFHWNHITLFVHPVVTIDRAQVPRIAERLAVHTIGLGLDRVLLRARVIAADAGGDAEPRPIEIHLTNPTGHKLEVRFCAPSSAPIAAATPYELKVQTSRGRGVPYPYEVVRMLTAEPGVLSSPETSFASGRFVEYDLLAGATVATPVMRPPGENTAGIVFGLISHQTDKHPEGMRRVIVLSDPLRDMGALAEPECARIIAALDLAEHEGLPVEWLPVSSGARIAMNSGTENLDWTARVLRRIVELTQRGGEINVIVDGVNVGAQSYFNAEATMLMHTRGVLIMTPRGSMVLTGKHALDYSGGVSAENELGIGGYERVMGPNGQAQYLARDLGHAFHLLFEHYRYTYIAPGERKVRPHASVDPCDRDITTEPYEDEREGGFSRLGQFFAREHNLERKKPFAMRALMRAVADRDGGWLERFAAMRNAETAIVWDCHLGGEAVCLIGFESRPLPRRGYVPGDGPDSWTGGTLFPLSSKKVARAVNAASGNRPVVVLANLSGFDGSPESMRRLQLEYGAEIGRAVVNFKGPLVFCVVARYHGGAYVVFSKVLNERLEVYAVEGAFASVIGGAPAAAVIFPREVRTRTLADGRVQAAQSAIDRGRPEERPRLREHYGRVFAEIQAEKQGEVAREFDTLHSVYRAREVGSLDAIIGAYELRAKLIASVAQSRIVRPALTS